MRMLCCCANKPQQKWNTNSITSEQNQVKSKPTVKGLRSPASNQSLKTPRLPSLPCREVSRARRRPSPRAASLHPLLPAWGRTDSWIRDKGQWKTWCCTPGAASYPVLYVPMHTQVGTCTYKHTCTCFVSFFPLLEVYNHFVANIPLCPKKRLIIWNKCLIFA